MHILAESQKILYPHKILYGIVGLTKNFYLLYLFSRLPITRISRIFFNDSQHSFTAQYMHLSFLIFLKRTSSFPSKSFAMLKAVESQYKQEDSFTKWKTITKKQKNYRISNTSNIPQKLGGKQANEPCQKIFLVTQELSSNPTPWR